MMNTSLVSDSRKSQKDRKNKCHIGKKGEQGVETANLATCQAKPQR